MTLRNYQQDLFDRIYDAFRRGIRNPLIVSATGSGKTATFCYIAHRAKEAGNPVLILVHRRELISQTSATLKRFGVPHGIIQPGVTADPGQLVQLAMVQTISRRVASIREPKLIIVDESHHAVSNTYKNIITAFPAAKIVGFTATPLRLDGRGLGDYFSEIILGPSVEWLMQNGHLIRPKYYAPPAQVVLKGIKRRAGDFATNELAEAMDKPTITGDAVKHYQRICPNSRAVVFCCNIKHAEHVTESFIAAGVPSGIIHGAMLPNDRKRVVEQLTSGEIMVMTSVDVVSEGFDLPSAEAAILLRPTTSLGLFLQQIGRILRPAEGKTAYVLDHVGNLKRHGLAEDDREWTLEGHDRKKAASESLGLKQCPECYCLHSPAPICPECQHVYKTPKARELSVIEGNLEEFVRLPLVTALKECKTRHDLKVLARAKSYKPGWVYYMAKEMNLK